jgi:type VI secretion system protein ImpE
MSSAEERVKSGDLQGALSDLQSRVRANPADGRLRVFLFQLLAVLGQWERALTQLKVAGELDSANLAMVRTYQEALSCEAVRASVFRGESTPMVFGEPAEWIALLIQALRLTALEKYEEARSLRERALADAPAVPGKIDGRAFEWLADADSRLGPVLEAVVNGRYYWIPFARLRTIKLEAPSDLRDLAWTAAQLTLANGGETVALIPTRYPGSEKEAELSLVMARATAWQERAGDTFLGRGQRLFTTNEGEYGLLDARLVELDAPVDTSPADSPAASG